MGRGAVESIQAALLVVGQSPAKGRQFVAYEGQVLTVTRGAYFAPTSLKPDNSTLTLTAELVSGLGSAGESFTTVGLVNNTVSFVGGWAVLPWFAVTKVGSFAIRFVAFTNDTSVRRGNFVFFVVVVPVTRPIVQAPSQAITSTSPRYRSLM